MQNNTPNKTINHYTSSCIFFFLLATYTSCCNCEKNKANESDTICTAELYGVTKTIPSVGKELSFGMFVNNNTSDTVFMPLNGSIYHPSAFKSAIAVKIKDKEVLGNCGLTRVDGNKMSLLDCKQRFLIPPGCRARVEIVLFGNQLDSLGCDYETPLDFIIPSVEFEYIFVSQDASHSNFRPAKLRFEKSDTILFIKKDWDIM